MDLEDEGVAGQVALGVQVNGSLEEEAAVSRVHVEQASLVAGGYVVTHRNVDVAILVYGSYGSGEVYFLVDWMLLESFNRFSVG